MLFEHGVALEAGVRRTAVALSLVSTALCVGWLPSASARAQAVSPACNASPCPQPAWTPPQQAAPAVAVEPPSEDRPSAPGAMRQDALLDPLSEQGQAARGLYFSGMRVRYLGAERIASTLKRARLNAAVIDLKDGEGQVTYDTAIEALRPQREVFIDDPAALVRELKQHGVYTIARIVCFTDPSLPRREPERAVLDGRPKHEGELWANWGGRNTWLDPYNEKNHDLVVSLAREAEAFGFDEIQFDYFRFPVDEAASFAVFPAEDGRERYAVLRDLLERVDRAVRIPLGVDVFGATAYRYRDITQLGQLVEHWTPYVEVLSPMLYLNGMRAWMRDVRQGRAERLIRHGVDKMRDLLGDGVVIRPYLQAFEAGADYYTPEFIAEQIRAVASGGGDGYLFWHPNSDYDLVFEAMRGPVRQMRPFPIAERLAARQQVVSARLERAGDANAPTR